MNVYFLNSGLKTSYTGIESSVLLRARLFIDYLGIVPILFLVNYNPHQFSDVLYLKKVGEYPEALSYINIYDLIQDIDRKKISPRDKKIYLNDSWTVCNVKGYKDKRVIDENGNLIMYQVYNRVTDNLHFINYFCNRSGKNIKTHRDYYDSFGFVSCRQSLNLDTGKVDMDTFYRQDGSTVLIKKYHYEDDSKKYQLFFYMIVWEM